MEFDSTRLEAVGWRLARHTSHGSAGLVATERRHLTENGRRTQGRQDLATLLDDHLTDLDATRVVVVIIMAMVGR